MSFVNSLVSPKDMYGKKFAVERYEIDKDLQKNGNTSVLNILKLCYQNRIYASSKLKGTGPTMVKIKLPDETVYEIEML